MNARIDQVVSAVNTWIVGDDEEVIVVDPGTDAAAVLAKVGDREIIAVICTHGHAGHATAAPAVAERDEAPIALHPADRLSWREVHGKTDPEIEMEDGGIFEVAGVALEVIHAPGHSSGSVCLYCEDLAAVMCGDVLAADGLVTSEDGFSSFSLQISAIGEHVLTLPSGTRVLPGHGKEFTVAVAEKNFDSWIAAGPASVSDGQN
ncbi:MAG: MBL fold metallo-hydrolase [Streptosporangiaceae bacterium]|jgi:glyoxylase-like metal-dependent hydrolase (beta-lactamase superfamily II)